MLRIKKTGIALCLAVAGMTAGCEPEESNTGITAEMEAVPVSMPRAMPDTGNISNEKTPPPLAMDSALSDFMFKDYAIERDPETLPNPDVQIVFLIDYNHDGLTDGLAYAKGLHQGAHYDFYSLGLYKNEHGRLRLVDELHPNYRVDTVYVNGKGKIVVEGRRLAPTDPPCCPSAHTTQVLRYDNDKLTSTDLAN